MVVSEPERTSRRVKLAPDANYLMLDARTDGSTEATHYDAENSTRGKIKTGRTNVTVRAGLEVERAALLEPVAGEGDGDGGESEEGKGELWEDGWAVEGAAWLEADDESEEVACEVGDDDWAEDPEWPEKDGESEDEREEELALDDVEFSDPLFRRRSPRQNRTGRKRKICNLRRIHQIIEQDQR